MNGRVAAKHADMILFLDIDGVLHPLDDNDHAHIDNLFCCAPLLWEILRQAPNLRVVFSTLWRKRHSLEELTEFATRGGGEDLGERFIGTTPELKDDAYPLRRRECEAWLAEHGGVSPRWLMLDDTPALAGFGVSSNVHIIDDRRGLVASDVIAITAKLKALSAA